MPTKAYEDVKKRSVRQKDERTESHRRREMDRGLNAARVEMQREKVEEVDVHILSDLAIGQTTAL